MGSIALNGANPGVAHPSTATGALTPGTYAFKAKWAGDTNYTGNTSSCESFTVNQSTSSVSTELHKADHSVVAVGGHVDLGTIMHDKATVTPDGTIAPTGNVNFTLYPSNDCSGQGTAMGSVALDGANPGVAHPSTSTSALGAGDYSFKATWAGDSNYTGNVSSCENFTVDKAQLSVDTTVHNAAHADITNTHVALGSIVHDTATVSGGVNGFSLPAVSFTLTSGYTGTCTAGDAVANNGTEGNAVKSADSAALGAGAYAYRAVVAGDSNYIGATGVCEPVTVDKAQLTVDTTVHDASHADITNSSVPLGSIVHDTATVTGGVNGFTVPTPTFTLTGSYTNSCANGDAVTNNGTEGSAAKSANSAALGAGMYAYRGAVAGNANYLGDVSDCEPFTVNKAQLTVTTSVHNALHADITNGHVPLGSVVHDTAAVTGGVNGFTVPTPIFTMTQSYNNDCSQGSSVANDGTDVVSGDAKSVDSNALTAGTYAYRGEVIGDNNYEGDVSDCEPFTVDKAQLHISTDIHDAAHASITSAALGSIVHDTAGVTGQVGSITPTGNVTFYFGQGAAQDCKDPNVYPVIATDANLDAGNNHPRSVDTGALAAGGYQFWAHVSGDDNYLGASSDCEPLTINKAQLTVTTIAHNSAHTDVTNTNVPLGSVLHDTATVTGGVSGFTVPTPTFSLTSGYTNSCANGTAVANGGTEGSADKSADSDPLAPGAYAYRASVAGNSNYLGDDSDCEPVTVIQGSSTITTELHEDATHAVITNGGESTTGNVHDSATVMVSPDFAPPSGNVTFRFYGSSAACSADTNFSGGLWSSTVALDGNNPGVAHPSTSTGALSAGTYAFKAKWAGDTNYTGNTSDCEVFTVSTLTINKLANGGNDTFGYTVTGPTNATPDVTTTGAPGQGTKTMVVLAGSYTVGETTMPAGWQFVGLNCAGVNGTTPTSAAFDIPAGTNRVCNFENTKNGATRTQGFWATHTAFANDVWTNDVPTSEKTLCGTKGVIDATAAAGQNELMGGFWSNVAKTSIGSGRSNLEKARIVLLQQLLAAELNRYGLGTNDGGLIAAARTAYCGTNLNAIKTSTGALDTFNQSGDSVPTGFTVPAATPKESKLEANIPFWNTTI